MTIKYFLLFSFLVKYFIKINTEKSKKYFSTKYFIQNKYILKKKLKYILRIIYKFYENYNFIAAIYGNWKLIMFPFALPPITEESFSIRTINFCFLQWFLPCLEEIPKPASTPFSTWQIKSIIVSSNLWIEYICNITVNN